MGNRESSASSQSAAANAKELKKAKKQAADDMKGTSLFGQLSLQDQMVPLSKPIPAQRSFESVFSLFPADPVGPPAGKNAATGIFRPKNAWAQLSVQVLHGVKNRRISRKRICIILEIRRRDKKLIGAGFAVDPFPQLPLAAGQVNKSKHDFAAG